MQKKLYQKKLEIYTFGNNLSWTSCIISEYSILYSIISRSCFAHFGLYSFKKYLVVVAKGVMLTLFALTLFVVLVQDLLTSITSALLYNDELLY